MRPYIANTWKSISILLLLSATACSKIALSPGGAQQSSLNHPQESVDGLLKDSFTFDKQNMMAKVDILIVDDNSGSMTDKQLKMQAGLQSFITSLGSVDWQIGITTTDVSTGPYGLQGSLLRMSGANTDILTPHVPNFQSVFEQNIVRSEVGSGDERPALAMIDAFGKRNTDNAGFFRDGASLAVIMLTDEDEASDGTNHPNTASDVMNSFTSTFGPDKELTVYGIIMIPGDVACYNQASPSGSSYGNMHAQLIQATGGQMASICDTDYGPALSSIGNQVVSGIKQVTLSETPDLGTMVIAMVPNDPTLTWSVNGRTVTFNKPPQQGTHMDITYKQQ